MRRSKAETDITILRLLEIGRKYFSDKGYAEVTLEEIVQEADLTRGAIYHHFKNKKGLFAAVFEKIQMEVGEYVEQEAGKSSDMWEQLMSGCRAFLSAAVKPDNGRILLIDGPSVLGWETFRRMDEQYSMHALKEQLLLMQENNLMMPVSIDALTHCLSGAINEAALWISESTHPEKATDEAIHTLHYLLQGFKLR